MRWILIAGLLAGCTTEKVVTTDCVSVDERAKKIKIGMTESQVIDIMGRPDGIHPSNPTGSDRDEDSVRFVYVQSCPAVHFVVWFSRNSVVRFGPSKGHGTFWGNEPWL